MDEIKFLKKFVSIYSPSKKENKSAKFLKNEMEKLGFKTRIDDVGNVIGVCGTGNLEILLVGHIDTVEGNLPVKIENGKLYGRGSVDAKGALTAMIFAAKNFVDCEDVKIVIIGAVEEEKESIGAKNILAKYNPDYIIIGEPSGWDSLTIGYRGCLKLLYEINKDLYHFASDKENAIEEVINFWNSIRKFCRKFQKSSVFESLGATPINFNSFSDGINVSAKINIGFRLPLGFENDLLISYIENIKNDGKVHWYGHEKPILREKNNKLVRAFLKSIRKNGGKPKFKKKVGTSDMNILGHFYDALILAYGPGEGKVSHTPNEHLNLEEFRKSIDVLKGVLRELI